MLMRPDSETFCRARTGARPQQFHSRRHLALDQASQESMDVQYKYGVGAVPAEFRWVTFRMTPVL